MDPAEIQRLRSWLSWRLNYPDESMKVFRGNRPDLFQALVGILDRSDGGVCMDSDFSGTISKGSPLLADPLPKKNGNECLTGR